MSSVFRGWIWINKLGLRKQQFENYYKMTAGIVYCIRLYAKKYILAVIIKCRAVLKELLCNPLKVENGHFPPPLDNSPLDNSHPSPDNSVGHSPRTIHPRHIYVLCIHTYSIHTYIHTYKHTYTHIHIRTYTTIHIQTYIHIYACI